MGGNLRIGFFAVRAIAAGEEITFDYQFERYGKQAQRCFCGTALCRGFIGSVSSEDRKKTAKGEISDRKVRGCYPSFCFIFFSSFLYIVFLRPLPFFRRWMPRLISLRSRVHCGPGSRHFAWRGCCWGSKRTGIDLPYCGSLWIPTRVWRVWRHFFAVKAWWYFQISWPFVGTRRRKWNSRCDRFLIDSLIHRSIHWLTHWLIDFWLIGRLMDWFFGRLINWLIDWVVTEYDFLVFAAPFRFRFWMPYTVFHWRRETSWRTRKSGRNCSVGRASRCRKSKTHWLPLRWLPPLRSKLCEDPVRRISNQVPTTLSPPSIRRCRRWNRQLGRKTVRWWSRPMRMTCRAPFSMTFPNRTEVGIYTEALWWKMRKGHNCLFDKIILFGCWW